MYRVSIFSVFLFFFFLKNGWGYSRSLTDIWCCREVSDNSLKYLIVIDWFCLKMRAKKIGLFLPCWFSKTLAQKPAVSPVHSKIPNEAKKMLTTLKWDRILGGYDINLSVILNRIGLNKIVVVKQMFAVPLLATLLEE